MNYKIHNAIGILLLPSCFILCIAEFIYCLDEHKEKFYFIESLDWFVNGVKHET